MKKLIFFFVLLVGHHALEAGVYLKVSLADTVACRQTMQALSSIEAIDRFQIVFPDEAKEHAAMLQERLQIDNFPKANLYFNTSFYAHLQNKSTGGSLFYINTKGSIVYQTELGKFNTEALLYYTRFSDKIISSLSIENKGFKGEATQGDLTSYSYLEGVRRNYVVDIQKGIKYDLSFTDEVVDLFYKKYLGSLYNTRFPLVQNMLKENKGLVPELWGIRQLKNSSQMLCEIHLYDTIDKLNKNTTYYHRSILAKYDTVQKKFTDVYTQSDAKKIEPNGIYFGGIEIFGGETYGMFSNKTSWYTFCKILFDEKNKTFSKSTNCLEDFIPAGYTERVNQLYSELYKNDGHSIVYRYADSLYDVGLKKFIHIPLPLSENGTQIEYEIRGLRSDWVSKYYHILYNIKDEKESKLLVINKESEIIIHKKIEGEYGDLISPYQILRYDKATKQYRIIDL